MNAHPIWNNPLLCGCYRLSRRKPIIEAKRRNALAIARHYGAKLYLVHVVSSLGLTFLGPDAVNMAKEIVWRDARELENHLVQSGAFTGFPHEVIVRQGNVWDELDQGIGQEQIDLVVIDTRTTRFGQAAARLSGRTHFRHVACIVLTVGPGSL